MSRINIRDTNEFSKLTSYYSSLGSKISSLEGKVNAIGNGLQGELKDYFEGEAQAVRGLISAARAKISAASAHINAAISAYNMTDANITSDLNKLLDEIFSWSYDSLFNSSADTNNSNNVVITLEEYIALCTNSDSLFNSITDGVVDDLKNQLQVQYQCFLKDTIPTVLNVIVENEYYVENGHNYSIDGLNNYKNNFANNVFNNYNIDESFNVSESNIPENIWNNNTKYGNSLLLLSYNSDGDIDKLEDIFTICLIGDNGNVTYRRPFVLLKETSNLLSMDLENKSVKDITNAYENYNRFIQSYNASSLDADIYNEHINLSSEVFKFNSYSPVNSNDINNAWIEALKKYGVSDDILSEYDAKDICNATWNNQFFDLVLASNGVDGLKDIVNSFYTNLGYPENYMATHINENVFRQFNNQEIINNDISLMINNSYGDFFTKKLQIDASKDNYKMALLQSLDTSGVTEDDIERIKEYYGNDSKYLEEWQIKAAAELMKNNISEDKFNIEMHEFLKKNDSDLELFERQVINNYGYAYGSDEFNKKLYELAYDNYGLSLVDMLKNDVLYNTIESGKGKEKAYILFDKFLSGISDENLIDIDSNDNILTKIGKSIISYAKLGGSTAAVTGLGFYDGIYNSVAGVCRLVTADGKMNAEDYRKMYFNELLSNPELVRKELGYNYSNVLNNLGARKFIYDTSSGVGNMIIPMALSSFVNPAAMSLWMGASVTGNEREQLLLSGKDNDLGTYLQAAAKGLLAVGTEKYLGALVGYGAKADDILSIFNMDNKLMNNFMSTNFGKSFAKVLSNQVNETVEELVENTGGHIIDLIFDGKIPDINELGKETLQTIFTTFATTPIINLMGAGMQNSKYSYGNHMHTHNINGVDVSYSNNELLQFTKNGVLDYEEFIGYLSGHGRIESNSTIVEDRLTENNTRLLQEAKDKLIELASAKGMTLENLGSQLGNIDPIKQEAADRYGIKKHEYAESIEKPITTLMYTLENESLSGITFEELQEKLKDGRITEYRVLTGLENNVKKADSISRKILSDADEKGIKLSQARDRIGDSVRYTLLVDEEHYIDTVQKSLQTLLDNGYTINNGKDGIKNLWGNERYQGVNCSIKTPLGDVFELQFHTADSFKTKEDYTHLFYEIWRNKFTTKQEKDLADQIQKIYQSMVNVPANVVGYDFFGGLHE